MGMVMSIASAGLAMYTSHMMTNVDMALIGKVLGLAEAQGGAMQEMMELSSPSFHVLGAYAQGTALQTGRKFLSDEDGQK